MTIKTKAKSHPRVTYLDTINFYGSNLESVNLAKRLHKNNQQMCIDCLKPRSNKSYHECKKMWLQLFFLPIVKDFYV